MEHWDLSRQILFSPRFLFWFLFRPAHPKVNILHYCSTVSAGNCLHPWGSLRFVYLSAHSFTSVCVYTLAYAYIGQSFLTWENGSVKTRFSDLLKVTKPGDKIIFKLHVAICPSAMTSSVEFCKYQDCSLALVPELD